MEDGLWRVVEAWNYWQREPEGSVPREVVEKALEMSGGFEAAYFYGPRRAGKTTACLQLLAKLSRKHGKRSCLYLNFEEPAFSARLSTEFVEEVVREFEKRFGKPPEFVFLDEAQNVPGWEKWVRTAADRKRFKTFVTSSSAKLLSSEFATTLGGVGLGFLVTPFSWREFKKAMPKAGFGEYLQTGGYPAVVLEENEEKKTRLLEEYFDSAIARDIAARYGVRDVPALRNLAAFVLTNAGKPFSHNKMRAMTGLSFDAIKEYLSHLQDAFIIFEVQHFSYSLKQALQKPRKYYAVDLGLQAAVTKSFAKDDGRRLENAVAIELFRRAKDFYYDAEQGEVDFVIKQGAGLEAVNATASESPPAREQKALTEFAKKHKNAQTTLLAGGKAVAEWIEKQ